MKLTQAIVLAAGLGTRMRPLTETLPKPLIPVAGTPLIDWCLDWLSEGGITHAVVNTSYLAEQLEAHLAQYRGLTLTISREEPGPLETGGGIKKALPLLGDGPFLAMNSDNIYRNAARHPVEYLTHAWHDDLDFLMLLHPKDKAIGWSGKGDFIMDAAGRVRRPEPGEDALYLFTGVEIIHPRVFAGSPEGAFSLNRLWDARYGADGWYARIRAVVYDGDWLNVGDLEGLRAAEAYLAASAIPQRLAGE
jgi:N-acetyl-alpha-D-muramate 1-phosphate uridylyltransferase